jgi:two-component system cell cycle sensor histidine kinase/response regulator CckA
MRNINLNEVIEETEELFRRLGGTSLTWQFKLDRNLGEVRADAGQLKQVLMNLVVNARDAMATGGKITIETANVEKPRPDAPSRERDQFVSVSVRDTGTGMSVETVEHLFEPFFTTKEPGRGTGLGLSIVHNIVRDLGGTIHVDSEKGRGSTFTVHLPRAASLAAVPPIEEATRAWPDDPPSVLIVENREKLRRIIGEHLTGSGYRIMEAADGEAALRLVSEHASNISLLVIGATVPPAGGFELAREIAATQDGVQAIFVSGYVQELADELEGAPAGASFLPRPFNVHELLSNVKALLEPKKAASMGASHSR